MIATKDLVNAQPCAPVETIVYPKGAIRGNGIPTELAETRALRGAALLDRQRPGWASQINRNALNLATDRGCILGQLFGCDYKRGQRWLWRVTTNAETDPHVDIVLGFWPANGPTSAHYLDDARALRAAWLHEISVRVGFADEDSCVDTPNPPHKKAGGVA